METSKNMGISHATKVAITAIEVSTKWS